MQEQVILMSAFWSTSEWDYKRFSRLYELQNLQNRIGLGRNKSERRRRVRNAGSITLEEGSFTTQDDGKSVQGG